MVFFVPVILAYSLLWIFKLLHLLLRLNKPALPYPANFFFLDVDLVPQLLDILVGLIEDLHESLVLLEINHLQPVVEVVLSQQLLSFLVLHGFLFYYFSLSVFQMVFENVGLPLRLGLTLLVKFVEIFGVLYDLVQEVAMAVLLASLLATPHVLLNRIYSTRFFFVLGCQLGAPVELPVD